MNWLHDCTVLLGANIQLSILREEMQIQTRSALEAIDFFALWAELAVMPTQVEPQITVKQFKLKMITVIINVSSERSIQ